MAEKTGIVKLNALDRAIGAVAPRWGLSRVRARAVMNTLARHYEAASAGRRTAGWHRGTADANAANGPALAPLRALARDLIRNNPWARRGQRVIANHTVGWGIVAKPVGIERPEAIVEAWRAWAETTECDSAGRRTFYGIQRQAIETIVEAGEVLIRRRWRRASDGLTIPLQLELLEPDFLDTSKDGMVGQAGGPIVQGVEFDMLGRRVAYWLFEQHPGASRPGSIRSRRVPAEEIIHGFRPERPGQERGVSWYAPVLVRLREYDEYEDATIVRHKVAALFAAFVTDPNGNPEDAAVGTQATDPKTGQVVESLEPAMIKYLAPGQTVEFASPPVAVDGGFSERTLRAIAAGLSVTYEDLTGDYSRVNFSSARMARLAHWHSVEDWQWNMIIPQVCDGVWGWAMEAAQTAGIIDEAPRAEWTPRPMPMIEPAQEGLAVMRQVRAGMKTFSQMVREQGGDPALHFDEYAKDLKKLDELGIKLDSDVRAVSQAGLTQERVGAGASSSGSGDASASGS